MKDLERLLALMKYCSDHEDYYGLETLYDVVVNKVPFDADIHDMDGALEVASHALYTIFDVSFEDQVIYGKPKLSMEGLMGDLVLLLERISNYVQGEADEWPN